MKRKNSQRKTTKILIQTVYPTCIALCEGKQEACSAEIRALALVLEISTTELKLKPKLLKCKNMVDIETFNVKTLNVVNQLPELTASVAEHDIDII